MAGNNRLQGTHGSVHMRPETEAVVALCGASVVGFFPPSSLAERSLCLIAVFSSPFPSVLTGRGGYNLGGPAEVEFWGH